MQYKGKKYHGLFPVLGWLTAALVTPCCLPTSLHADQWAVGEAREHEPASPENRIIKWCNESSNKTRYASANIKLAGWQPCGKLLASKTCDASGNRMISTDQQRPNGQLDCGIGPRITVINHAEGDIIDTSALAGPEHQAGPMSASEEAAFRDKLKQINDKNAASPAAQIQQIVNTMLKNLSSPQSGRPNPKDAKKLQTELDSLLKQIDPNTRQTLEQLMRQYGIR